MGRVARGVESERRSTVNENSCSVGGKMSPWLAKDLFYLTSTLNIALSADILKTQKSTSNLSIFLDDKMNKELHTMKMHWAQLFSIFLSPR